MATVDLTTIAGLEETLSQNDTVLIDFWADWCGPCKMFGPIYTDVSNEYPEVHFTKVNTEEAQELAAAFSVSSIPMLAVFREGIMVYKPGIVPKEGLNDLLKQVRELNMDEVRAQVAEEQN